MERNLIHGSLGFGWLVLLRHLLIVHFRKLAKFPYKFGCRLRLQLPLKKLTSLPARLDLAYCMYAFWVSRFLFSFFSFFSKRMNSNSTVHAHGFTIQEKKCALHRTYNHFIMEKKILKMGPTSLFTHSKLFCYSVFSFQFFAKYAVFERTLHILKI